MSRFLGPIHHWLFSKINLFEELEKEIINEIENKLDINIKDIVNEAIIKYGDYIPNEPLENLIDTNNIHGWLQNRITIAETRQAKIISDIINKYGDSAFDIIKETYKLKGKECGIDAKERFQVSTPSEIYKTLNNYILDGMPCDNVNNIVINEENLLQWNVTNCLHKRYWEAVDSDINIFYNLRTEFIKEFVEKANKNMYYEFMIENNTLINKIIKK